MTAGEVAQPVSANQPQRHKEPIVMPLTAIEHALELAEATLMKTRCDRSRRLHQITEADHNIAMLLVQITELRAAKAAAIVELD